MRSFAKQFLLISTISTTLALAPVSSAAELKAMPEVITSSSNDLFNSQLKDSLLTLSRVQHTPNKACKVVKRNELYELSAILSDKIHVFLAYFDSKPKYQFVEKEEDKNALTMNRPLVK